ncbi:hypothetical protein LXL04_006666 [Taraxacum kok-saghyz]
MMCASRKKKWKEYMKEDEHEAILAIGSLHVYLKMPHATQIRPDPTQIYIHVRPDPSSFPPALFDFSGRFSISSTTSSSLPLFDRVHFPASAHLQFSTAISLFISLSLLRSDILYSCSKSDLHPAISAPFSAQAWFMFVSSRSSSLCRCSAQTPSAPVPNPT